MTATPSLAPSFATAAAALENIAQLRNEISALEKSFDKARTNPQRRKITRKIIELKQQLSDMIADADL